MEIAQKLVSEHTVLTTVSERIARTWIEINRQALEHNLSQYKNLVMPALFAPVIKSNAYGHGIEAVARICEQSAAVDRVCVVSLSEGIYLRSLGIKKQIVVLSILDVDFEQVALHMLIVTIYDLETAHALNNIGQCKNQKITVHIKIDTGLSRLGVLAVDAVKFILAVAALPFIFIEGLFTHFANSECEDQRFTQYQLLQFQEVVTHITSLGIHIPLHHASCSAAITAQSATHQTMARAGIGIYGLWPSQENKNMTHVKSPLFHLKPVLTWKTTIMHLKEVPLGSYVGYDLTYQTNKATRIATLPVGYFDGYDRKLSNNSAVLVRNQQAPVIGRVAMNLMMIDVSAIQGVAVGDEVILLGDFLGVTADDLAVRSETINYEIITHINAQLPRIIV